MKSAPDPVVVAKLQRLLGIAPPPKRERTPAEKARLRAGRQKAATTRLRQREQLAGAFDEYEQEMTESGRETPTMSAQRGQQEQAEQLRQWQLKYGKEQARREVWATMFATLEDKEHHDPLPPRQG